VEKLGFVVPSRKRLLIEINSQLFESRISLAIDADRFGRVSRSRLALEPAKETLTAFVNIPKREEIHQ
jgi:hypothetical protein